MKYLSFAILYLCSLFVFAEPQTVVNLSSRSEHLILKLPANPTTGYQWRVKSYDHTLFALTKSQYHASSTQRIGSGGEMVFVFTCLHAESIPKSTNIQFEYARPWTKNGSTLKDIKIKFQ